MIIFSFEDIPLNAPDSFGYISHPLLLLFVLLLPDTNHYSFCALLYFFRLDIESR